MSYGGKWCTAKILHKMLLSYSHSNEELVAEVKKQCNTLHHPNLVTFIGITEVDEQPIIMTELMEVNLFTYIEQNNNLTLDTQISLCKDMVRGLEVLHKHSLLHKNLHSHNVLIQDNQAKISDYYYPLLQVEGYMPNHNDIAPFMAPEVTEDQLKFSQSSDIFSLAVLFLNVITGKAVTLEHKQNLVTFSNKGHILLPLIQQCLSEKADNRPSAMQVYGKIKEAQDTPQYICFKALEHTVSSIYVYIYIAIPDNSYLLLYLLFRILYHYFKQLKLVISSWSGDLVLHYLPLWWEPVLLCWIMSSTFLVVIAQIRQLVIMYLLIISWRTAGRGYHH